LHIADTCFSLVPDPSAGWSIYPLSTLVAAVQPWIPILGSSYSCCHVTHLPHTTARVGGAAKVTLLNLERGLVLQLLKLFFLPVRRKI